MCDAPVKLAAARRAPDATATWALRIARVATLTNRSAPPVTVTPVLVYLHTLDRGGAALWGVRSHLERLDGPTQLRRRVRAEPHFRHEAQLKRLPIPCLVLVAARYETLVSHGATKSDEKRLDLSVL